MRRQHSILSYPLIIKKVNDYMVFQMPDLGLTHVIPLPRKGKINPKFMIMVAKSIASLWVKAQERIDNFNDTTKNHDLPSPSSIKKSLNPTKEVDFTAPQVAKILNVHPDTVRRAADRGQIPFSLTTGGHRRFAEDDIQSLKETLSESP